LVAIRGEIKSPNDGVSALCLRRGEKRWCAAAALKGWFLADAPFEVIFNNGDVEIHNTPPPPNSVCSMRRKAAFVLILGMIVALPACGGHGSSGPLGSVGGSLDKTCGLRGVQVPSL
jgi:hypothetical protein